MLVISLTIFNSWFWSSGFCSSKLEVSDVPIAIGTSETSNFDEQNPEDQNQLLKIVKDITSKGFVRNNYKKNLVDLSDVKISLKGKK